MQEPRAQTSEDHARQRLGQDVRPLVLGGHVARDAIMGIGDAAPIVAAASAMNSKEEEAMRGICGERLSTKYGRRATRGALLGTL